MDTKIKSDWELIQEIEKEIADKKAELELIRSKKISLKEGDIIMITRDLEWVCSRGTKMEVHSVSAGHIHAGFIGKASSGTYWISDGDYVKYMEKEDYITGSQPLEYRNNWENDVYTIKGKTVSDLTKVKINGSVYTVTSKMVSVSYSDHGHTYSSKSKHYFVSEKVFGKSTVFDLNTIIRDRTVTAVEYTIDYTSGK